MKELKYPIYFIGASWKQDRVDYNNGTGFSKMYKVDPGITAMRQTAIDWFSHLMEKPKYKNKNCELIRLDCNFVENETWCCQWFNHYTFNNHLSDSDLEISFASFVNRKKCLPVEKQALMGAEDHWRWQPPCRCKECQERGVVYIDH